MTAVAEPRARSADGRPLDTSAQPGKTAELCGSSEGRDPQKTLQKRARAKALSQSINVRLAELDGSPLEKRYRSAFYCGHEVFEDAQGVLRSKRCNQRSCIPCAHVRTARAIDRYRPALAAVAAERGERQFFVTLTRPNVRAPELAREVRALLRSEKRIRDAMRKANPEGRRLAAVRKIEVTPNVERGTFHPHLHYVVVGEADARELVRRWLDANATAVPAAQDVRPVVKGTETELFKYVTKLTAKTEDGRREWIEPAALDVIFCALDGRRTWQALGDVLGRATGTDEEDGDDMPVTMAPRPRGREVTWEWARELSDWVDFTTGEVLSDYEPSRRVARLVDRERPEPPRPRAGDRQWLDWLGRQERRARELGA